MPEKAGEDRLGPRIGDAGIHDVGCEAREGAEFRQPGTQQRAIEEQAEIHILHCAGAVGDDEMHVIGAFDEREISGVVCTGIEADLLHLLAVDKRLYRRGLREREAAVAARAHIHLRCEFVIQPHHRQSDHIPAALEAVGLQPQVAERPTHDVGIVVVDETRALAADRAARLVRGELRFALEHGSEHPQAPSKSTSGGWMPVALPRST